MTHTRSLLAGTLALTLAACGQQPALSPTASSAPAVSDSAAGAYLVGFRQDALSSQSLSAQAAVQAQAITAAGGMITSQWADISAAAVKLTPAALAKLKNNPMVEYVEQEAVHHALGGRNLSTDARVGGKPGTITPASTTAAPFTPSGEYTWGDNSLRVPALKLNGYTGASSTKVAVCVLDTGIDGNHPEFQRKLAGFRNFTGEVGRDDPYKLNDVSHHGTHVSGTVFAQYGVGSTGLQSGMDANGVGGVAAGADLFMGRVLGDTGSGSSSNIINGLNWCVSRLANQGGTEGKVVVSMSLGGGRKSLTEQRAYTGAYTKGVLIVAATGNDGAAVSYPAAYDNVVGVAAVDNTLAKASFSNFGAQVDLSGPGVGVLSSVPLGVGAAATASGGGVTFADVSGADKSAKATFSGAVIRAGDGTGTAGANQFCGTSTRNTALSGNIALISRGTCAFEEKVANASASGAKAVMVYNNVAGPLGMSLTNAYSIPVVGILQVDGDGLITKLASGSVSGTASVTSADYEYFDGTSMATPHVAASAAVVWAALPNLTNTQLLSKLTGTAKDLGAVGRDDNFGYGLIDPYRAITGN